VKIAQNTLKKYPRLNIKVAQLLRTRLNGNSRQNLFHYATNFFANTLLRSASLQPAKFSGQKLSEIYHIQINADSTTNVYKYKANLYKIR